MLIRRCAGLAVATLLLGLLPPLSADAAHAAAPGDWVSRFGADFLEAREINRGQDVKIALISDGVEPGVRTLRGALEKGRDFVGTPRPKREMGTLMASLIVGGGPTADAPLGVPGLASGATLLPVRVYATPDDPGGRDWLEKNGNNWGRVIGQGIRYAADQGAEVIAVEAVHFVWNKGDEQSEYLMAAVAHAQRKDAVIVAVNAVGDDPGGVRLNNPVYPAAAPGVIGVGAVTAKGRRDGKHTVKSSAVLLSAPGLKIPSIGPDGRLWTYWGGGAAMSWVTAAAAMVRSEYPKLTAAQVTQAIASSARHPKGEGRYDADLGYGYVNAKGALDAARELSDKPVPPVVAKAAVKDGAHFGEERGTIRAVPYNPFILGGFGALTLAGLGAILFAGWMAVRRRRYLAGPAVAESEPLAPESSSADSP